MSTTSPKHSWCVARLGSDLNWWVTEISDPIHWDLDGLGIVDPRQVEYLIDLFEPLQEYGFESDYFENAFFGFSIEAELKDNHIRLQRSKNSILDTTQKLFALPDFIDEEKGPYSDFIEHITKLRVKMLNDLIDFTRKFTVDELEEEIREQQNNDLMEGRASHVFSEVCSILEFVPAGYELEIEGEEEPASGEELEEDFPEIDEQESDEDIVKDETMQWEEEEEEEEELPGDKEDER